MSRPAFYSLPGRTAVCAVAVLAILQLSGVFARAQFTKLGTIKHFAMSESSGLAASKQYPDIVWTHGDGSSRFLFSMRTNGLYVRSFPVMTSFVDWEDIMADNSGNLYLADTGSDGAQRSHVAIHRVREPIQVYLSTAERERRSGFSRMRTVGRSSRLRCQLSPSRTAKGDERRCPTT